MLAVAGDVVVVMETADVETIFASATTPCTAGPMAGVGILARPAMPNSKVIKMQQLLRTKWVVAPTIVPDNSGLETQR
jgi:hypothetical protein